MGDHALMCWRVRGGSIKPVRRPVREPRYEWMLKPALVVLSKRLHGLDFRLHCNRYDIAGKTRPWDEKIYRFRRCVPRPVVVG